jgi:hypothetical protein
MGQLSALPATTTRLLHLHRHDELSLVTPPHPSTKLPHPIIPPRRDPPANRHARSSLSNQSPPLQIIMHGRHCPIRVCHRVIGFISHLRACVPDRHASPTRFLFLFWPFCNQYLRNESTQNFFIRSGSFQSR